MAAQVTSHSSAEKIAMDRDKFYERRNEKLRKCDQRTGGGNKLNEFSNGKRTSLFFFFLKAGGWRIVEHQRPKSFF